MRLRAKIRQIHSLFEHLEMPEFVDFIPGGGVEASYPDRSDRFDDIGEMCIALAITLLELDPPVVWTIHPVVEGWIAGIAVPAEPRRLILKPSSRWPGMDEPWGEQSQDRKETVRQMRRVTLN